ncbi:hypothetical protein GCM10010350_17650 [Streptomyces galilaeus]|nr:hypothetical protein GCM10010350_17650 [Streptomyces galilaeus]
MRASSLRARYAMTVDGDGRATARNGRDPQDVPGRRARAAYENSRRQVSGPG